MNKGLRRWSAVVFSSVFLLFGQSLPLLAQSRSSKAKNSAPVPGAGTGLQGQVLGPAQLAPLTVQPQLQSPIPGLQAAPAARSSVRPTPAGLSIPQAPQPNAAADAAPAALPASAVPAVDLPAVNEAAPAAGETVLEFLHGQPNHLGRRFDEARHDWLKANDDTPEIAAQSFDPQVDKVHAALRSQLASMAALPGNENDPLFAVIERNADLFMSQIDAHIKSAP